MDKGATRKSSTLYVGVGVGTYNHEVFAPLPQAICEVKEVAEILEIYRYEAHVIVDPNRAGGPDALESRIPKDVLGHGGCLVVHWSGHGELTPEGKLNLVATDGKPMQPPLITTEYLAGLAARSGANQILLILDTCYSGGGVIAASTVANEVLRMLPPENPKIWIGVVASAMDYERAKDGVFGARLIKLLRKGPTPDNPELWLRWSDKNEWVMGADLIYALLEEWDLPGQSPKVVEIKNVNCQLKLPNPLYKPDAPEHVVEHLTLAARGVGPQEEGYFFTGRTSQLDRIVSWMQAGRPGIFIITGPAGSGKSAISGRIASLSNPEERAQILEAEHLEHADPGEHSVHAHVYARGVTAERLAEALDVQLVKHGVLPANPTGPRNRWELAGALQRVSIRPIIIIDGLDEAGPESWQIAQEVIPLLAINCLVIVSTRDLTPREEGLSLIQGLVSSEVLDLGDETLQTQSDLRRYIEKRLAALSQSMSIAKVSDAVLRIACEQKEGMFLLARIITSQLRNAPVDTSLPGWEEGLDRSIDEAFDRDISKIGEERELSRARELLTALAWGYGSGLPDDIWPVIATAISSTEVTYQRPDVFWLLGKAGRYVVECGEGGRAVYRLAHQRFGEYLRPAPTTASESVVMEEISSKIAPALVRYYLQFLDIGQSEKDHPYLRKYIWRHCSDAGEIGIAALRKLVEYNKESFESDLAEALNSIGNRYDSLGRSSDAVKLTEDAARLYSKLAKTNPAFEPSLASVLNKLGDRYSSLGRRLDAVKQTEKAAKLYTKLVYVNPVFKPDLAESLMNLGNGYIRLDKNLDAVKSIEKATKLYSKLAIKSPIFMLDLAKAQNDLGNLYGSLGKSLEAAKSTEKATKWFNKLVIINPCFKSDLAKTQINLENYSRRLVKSLEVAKPIAVKPTLDLKKFFDTKINIHPVFKRDLSKMQINLKPFDGSLGKSLEAANLAEKAVKLHSDLVINNISLQPKLIAFTKIDKKK